MKNTTIFAENFNRLLQQNNKTRRDVSDELAIPYSTVCSWGNGTQYPRIDKIEKLAAYFGVNKADLIEPKDVTDKTLEHMLNARPKMKRILELANKAEDKDVDIVIAILEALTKNNGGNNS